MWPLKAHAIAYSYIVEILEISISSTMENVDCAVKRNFVSILFFVWQHLPGHKTWGRFARTLFCQTNLILFV